MRPRRAALAAVPRLHLPLVRVALCLDCDSCFELGVDQCPSCGSETWSPLSRFIGDASDKSVVRAVRALVEEAEESKSTQRAHHWLIVSRTQPQLFDMLRRELSDNPTIAVTHDRRSGGGPTRLLSNRRRRHVDYQLRAFGWAIVRRDAPATETLVPARNGSHR